MIKLRITNYELRIFCLSYFIVTHYLVLCGCMTQKKKMTITDVARATGVSVTTVSLVLNGKAEGHIGPSTIRKVKDYAKKVGYKPNPIARSHHKKTKVFGILLENIAAPQQSRLVSEIEKLLRKQGQHSLVVSMNGDTAAGEGLLRILQDRNMDGYVLMSFENIERTLKKMLMAHTRVVLYDCVAEGMKVGYVVADYKPKLAAAIHDYWSMHKNARIGLLVCPSNAYRMREFQDAYMSAMDKYAGDVLMKKIQISLEDTEVQSQIRDFIQHNRLDAVLFSTDQLARIGIGVIKNEHLSVECVISTYVPLSTRLSAINYVAVEQDIPLMAENIVKGLLS